MLPLNVTLTTLHLMREQAAEDALHQCMLLTGAKAAAHRCPDLAARSEDLRQAIAESFDRELELAEALAAFERRTHGIESSLLH